MTHAKIKEALDEFPNHKHNKEELVCWFSNHRESIRTALKEHVEIRASAYSAALAGPIVQASETVGEDKRKFKCGDRVRKLGDKGQWHGHVVGFYSASCTPIGYAVESERETGSVQIYPESALEGLDYESMMTSDEIALMRTQEDAGGEIEKHEFDMEEALNKAEWVKDD